jgi:hypothetical protein
VCLSTMSSRTLERRECTAYKVVVGYGYRGMVCPPLYEVCLYTNGRWNKDTSYGFISSKTGVCGIKPQGSPHEYRLGFHAYETLRGAMKYYYTSAHNFQEFQIWEVRMRYVVARGWQSHSKVVVARHIKFIRRVK